MGEDKKVKKTRKYNPFLEFIHERIDRNQNCIIVVVGGTGSGKSYLALRLAEELDQSFTTDNIAFGAIEFLKLTGKSHPPGTVIIFDEGGVDLGAREFMSKKNRGLSKIMQTVRYKNHIIIFTVPDLKFLDTHARKLTHIIIKTRGIRKDYQLCKASPYLVKTNPVTGYILNPFPTANIDGIGKIRMRYIYVKKPSAKLVHAYERIKKKFGDSLNDKYLKEFQGMQNTKGLNDKQKAVYYAAMFGIPDKIVAKKIGVKATSISKMRSDVRKLGYHVVKERQDVRKKRYATTNPPY